MGAISQPPRDAASKRHEQQATWKTGAAFAGIAGIASFQPSLLPRTKPVQAVVTGLAVGLGYGAGVGASAIANAVDSRSSLDAIGSQLGVAGAGVLGVAAATLALRGRPSHLGLAAARTASGVIGAGAVAGAAIAGEQELVDAARERIPGGAGAAHAAIIGSTALAAGALLLHRPRASAVSTEAEASYLKSVGGTQNSTSITAAFDQAHFERLTSLREQMTTMSGRPGTRLPLTPAQDKGWRFTHEVTPPAEIARVMDVPVAGVKAPVRVYGALEHGADHEAIATGILDETRRLGGFGRSMVVLHLPSGSGHVNPATVAASEYLAHGDVTSIAMQYNNQRSLSSLDDVDDAEDLFGLVLRKTVGEIASLPAGQRPKLVVSGESLGGLGVQEYLERIGAAESIQAAGIDVMFSSGTPRISSFRTRILGGDGHRIDPSGTIVEFDNAAELRALPAEQRTNLRGYFWSRRNDPVNKVSPRIFFERPEWLSDPAEALGVPRRMKWIPGVTGLQAMGDIVQATSMRAGVLERTGHDYRRDMVDTLDAMLDLGSGPAQRAGSRIEPRAAGARPQARPVAGCGHRDGWLIPLRRATRYGSGDALLACHAGRLRPRPAPARCRLARHHSRRAAGDRRARPARARPGRPARHRRGRDDAHRRGVGALRDLGRRRHEPLRRLLDRPATAATRPLRHG